MADPQENTFTQLPHTLHVHVVGDIHEISKENIFDFFWNEGSGVDTTCMVCGEGFDTASGPPIRTTSFSEGGEWKHGDFKNIRVYNRHHKCIEAASIEYISISHVWHDGVREAHETRKPNDKGAQLILRMPLKVLIAATTAFPNSVPEIWHDYWSVPQWNFSTQQQILLSIPMIYRMPKKIIVQLEDYDSKYIQLMLEFGPILDRDMRTLERLEERFEAVEAYYKSHWPKRMWVALEFAQSKRACVLDSNFRIWRLPDSSRGSFSQLDYECLRNYIMVFDVSESQDRKDYLETLRYVTRGQEVALNDLRSLGDTLDDYSARECKYHRDRFIAIHATLEKDSLKTDASTIPKDQVGACSWVWKRAMGKGDYSPLLLQPNGHQEKEVRGLSWLVGHELMNAYTWDFGRPLSIPPGATILRDGFVEPQLEYVGIITEIHHLDLYRGDIIAQLDITIGLSMGLSRWDVATFVATMKRLYPILLFFKTFFDQGLPGYKNVPESLEQYVSEDADFEAKLDKLLKEYYQALTNQDSEIRTKRTTQIADLMQLDVLIGPMENDTRLRDAVRRAKWRYLRDSGADEPICTVVCQHCLLETLYKPDLRNSGQVGAKIYRIPGLNFSLAADEGVGLVVLDGRVVGRMRSGTPACKCRISESVRLV